VRAHAHDLRAEVATDFGVADESAADDFTRAVAADWREAPLSAPDIALCRYAEALTMELHRVDDGQILELRRTGFDDTAIHDATQVISYFNYINRIAESLGVEEETFVRAWEQEGSGQALE
jgi:uncharacterized peroxidase-related enzyme